MNSAWRSAVNGVGESDGGAGRLAALVFTDRGAIGVSTCIVAGRSGSTTATSLFWANTAMASDGAPFACESEDDVCPAGRDGLRAGAQDRPAETPMPAMIRTANKPNPIRPWYC